MTVRWKFCMKVEFGKLVYFLVFCLKPICSAWMTFMFETFHLLTPTNTALCCIWHQNFLKWIILVHSHLTIPPVESESAVLSEKQCFGKEKWVLFKLKEKHGFDLETSLAANCRWQASKLDFRFVKWNEIKRLLLMPSCISWWLACLEKKCHVLRFMNFGCIFDVMCVCSE